MRWEKDREKPPLSTGNPVEILLDRVWRGCGDEEYGGTAEGKRAWGKRTDKKKEAIFCFARRVPFAKGAPLHPPRKLKSRSLSFFARKVLEGV